jgi:hypothetical protein
MIKLGYVSLRVGLEMGRAIYAQIKHIPMDATLIKPHDMHMTLMYDKSNPIPIENAKVFGKPQLVHTGTIVDIQMLGVDEEGKGAIVLTIDAPSAQARHEELSFFMNHSFDPFLAHVSVAYGASPEAFETVKSALYPMIGKELKLYGESFAELKKED